MPTPLDRPADQLRAAAKKVRALATAASTDTDGTPTTTWNSEPLWPSDPDGRSRLYGDYRTRDDGRRIAWPSLLHGGSQRRAVSMHTQHADYIAAMGPGVGLAVARWLESWSGVDLSEHGPMPEDAQHALAVARQLLLDTTSAHRCADCSAEFRPGMDVELEHECTTELTADEAREMADELNTELYQARDALAFVGECCDIADRKQRPITTGDVREWLKGARCGRQLLGASTGEAKRNEIRQSFAELAAQAREDRDHEGAADVELLLRDREEQWRREDAAAVETDEEREQREDREATARDHAAGDHQHCGITCEVELPTDHLRNFVIAKGYPGTAGALDELLRRVAAAPKSPAAPLPGVWTVWAEDESTLGYYTDEVTAKLAAIEHHQEAETPGLEFVYGWNEHGGRLELLADGDDTGIRVKGSTVQGAPPAPADRAAVLREAADHLHAKGQPVCDPADGDCCWYDAVTELRRLAGEAAAGAHHPTPGEGDPVADYSYRWGQTIISADGGRTVRIPGDDCDGNPALSVWVHRGDAGVLAAMLTDAAGAHQTEQAQPELTEGERQFLTFALDQGAEELSLSDGFTDENRAALEKFRAMAATPAVPAAPEENR